MSMTPEDQTMRTRLDSCHARERRIMDLLKTTNPDRIEHDLRNVLNELNLLRMLFEKLEAEENHTSQA